MNDLVAYEKALAPMLPVYKDLLKGLPVTPERLVRTVLISVERAPHLRQCSMDSIVQSATTAAVLGLEVDGVTGQGFLLPFKQQAQFVIGYKGYNTLAYRAGYTVTGGIIREQDDYDFQLGTKGYIRHRPKLGAGKRPIIAAWAQAEQPGFTPIISVVELDELMAVKNKSPGARRSQSPWNDPEIGFPAMCEKTAKRRLARSMPLNLMQAAAAIDQAQEEMGRPAWLDETGKPIIDGEADVVTPEHEEGTYEPEEEIGAPFDVSMVDGSTRYPANAEEWVKLWGRILDAVTDESLKAYWNLNAAKIRNMAAKTPWAGQDVLDQIAERINVEE